MVVWSHLTSSTAAGLWAAPSARHPLRWRPDCLFATESPDSDLTNGLALDSGGTPVCMFSFMSPNGRARTTPCKCGHDDAAHEHYRAGTDCGTCQCGHYRRARQGVVAETTSIVAETTSIVAAQLQRSAL
jgi:hypothetical protein